jgi:hypothetical protein
MVLVCQTDGMYLNKYINKWNKLKMVDATSADVHVYLFKFSINSDVSDVMDQSEYSRMELKYLQLAAKRLQNDNVYNNAELLVESCNVVYTDKVLMSARNGTVKDLIKLLRLYFSCAANDVLRCNVWR